MLVLVSATRLISYLTMLTASMRCVRCPYIRFSPYASSLISWLHHHRDHILDKLLIGNSSTGSWREHSFCDLPGDLATFATMATSSPLSRSKTPGRTPVSEHASPPPIPQDESRGRATAQRRPSFSFLRRGKSSERTMSMRSISGGKLTKKQTKEVENQKEHEAAAIPQQPPQIPDLPRPARLQTFGGENVRPGKYATIADQMTAYSRERIIPSGSVDMTRSNIPPIPPMPGDKNGGYVDPYARTESMTHRGRYSYASSAVSTINSPRRIRRRKDPTPFKYALPSPNIHGNH